MKTLALIVLFTAFIVLGGCKTAADGSLFVGDYRLWDPARAASQTIVVNRTITHSVNLFGNGRFGPSDGEMMSVQQQRIQNAINANGW